MLTLYTWRVRKPINQQRGRCVFCEIQHCCEFFKILSIRRLPFVGAPMRNQSITASRNINLYKINYTSFRIFFFIEGWSITSSVNSYLINKLILKWNHLKFLNKEKYIYYMHNRNVKKRRVVHSNMYIMMYKGASFFFDDNTFCELCGLPHLFAVRRPCPKQRDTFSSRVYEGAPGCPGRLYRNPSRIM